MKLEPFAVSQLPKKALALVLAGGRGSRLHAADRHPRQAGGVFRRQVPHRRFRAVELPELGHPPHAVLTQYKSHSLLRHIQRGWGFLKPEMNEFGRPAAGAAAHRRGALVPRDGRRGVPEPRHHPARTDPNTSWCWPATTYTRWTTRGCCADHVEHGAPCTVGCIEVPLAEASAFGVMAVDDDAPDRRAFSRSRRSRRRCPARPDVSLASMGIYVFDAEFLYEQLPRTTSPTRHSSHDFGRDVIPRSRGGRPRVGPSVRASAASPARAASRRTGATSARSTPTGRPTST